MSGEYPSADPDQLSEADEDQTSPEQGREGKEDVVVTMKFDEADTLVLATQNAARQLGPRWGLNQDGQNQLNALRGIGQAVSRTLGRVKEIPRDKWPSENIPFNIGSADPDDLDLGFRAVVEGVKALRSGGWRRSKNGKEQIELLTDVGRIYRKRLQESQEGSPETSLSRLSDSFPKGKTQSGTIKE